MPHDVRAMTRPPQPEVTPLGVQTLRTGQIRRDGETQCRVAPNEEIVAEYAELIQSGLTFPPVRVWFDGESYWLSDGFQRVAAAEKADRSTIAVEVLSGTLEDARWDSYAANSRHGLRRTKRDKELAVKRALAHPNASTLSNVQIAKHLNIPEPTLRRWRKSISPGDASQRVATRDGNEYSMNIGAIGRSGSSSRPAKCGKRIETDLDEMKTTASEPVRSALNIVGHWLLGYSDASDCLGALERLMERLRRT